MQSRSRGAALDILITVLLPLALVVIMIALGLGLTLDDFRQVAASPRAFLAGAVAQMVLLPLAALFIVFAFGLTSDTALGLLILSLCPGGPTSNALSRFARGDVALSVSLTAVTSLLAVVTMPVLIALFVAGFGRTDLPRANVTEIAILMSALTVLPVALGMVLRKITKANRHVETVFNVAAAVLFGVIVFGALAVNWSLFTANFAVIGLAVVALIVLMLAIGVLVSRLAGLSVPRATTIAIDTGIQNATLGITVGALLMATPDNPVPAVAMPAAVYGVTMYFIVVPFALWRRSITPR